MVVHIRWIRNGYYENPVYRPYRDLRFSRDKTTYKDHQGMFVEAANGLGWYVQVSSEGILVAGGWYRSDSGQLTRFRQRIDAGAGPELQRHLDGLADAGFLLAGDRLKTQPRGFRADHPQVELLRHKTLYASQEWPPEGWMGTPGCAEHVARAWRTMTPWLTYLAELVGEGRPRL